MYAYVQRLYLLLKLNAFVYHFVIWLDVIIVRSFQNVLMCTLLYDLRHFNISPIVAFNFYYSFVLCAICCCLRNSTVSWSIVWFHHHCLPYFYYFVLCFILNRETDVVVRFFFCSFISTIFVVFRCLYLAMEVNIIFFLCMS